MRIAFVHSFYRNSSHSGENAVVVQQAEALEAAGNPVHIFRRETDDLVVKDLFPFRAGLTVASGFGPNPLSDIQKFSPDLIHVHNLFPNWGSTWIKKSHVPVFATLHNFRTICPAGTLSRNGASCELCPSAGPINSVIHRCYKKSAVKTVPLAISAGRRTSVSVLGLSDHLVYLSENSKSLFQKFGVTKPSTVIPNFVEDRFQDWRYLRVPKSRYWVFVGRLSPEKGVLEMIEAWPDESPLLVVGDGPLLEESRCLAARKKIEFSGPLPPGEVSSILRRATGLVFPSVNPENSPLVFIEALSAGLPVLARQGNTVAQQVQAGGFGKVYESAAELHKAIRTIEEDHFRFAAAARKGYEDNFTKQKWLERTLDLYTTTLRALEV